MPKFHAAEADADRLRRLLAAHQGLGHLRVRRYADALTIESGPAQDPIPHARIKRDTVHLWKLEMATHMGRWQTTPFRNVMENLLELLVEEFGFTLAARE